MRVALPQPAIRNLLKTQVVIGHRDSILIVKYNIIMQWYFVYIDDSSVASAPGAAPSASSGASLLRETLADLTKRCPTPFNMIDLSDRSMQVGV